MSVGISSLQLRETIPPLYEAQYGQTPVLIRLDASAVIKLEGIESIDRRDEILREKSEYVRQAAERMIKSQRIEGDQKQIVLTLTALDIE